VYFPANLGRYLGQASWMGLRREQSFIVYQGRLNNFLLPTNNKVITTVFGESIFQPRTKTLHYLFPNQPKQATLPWLNTI